MQKIFFSILAVLACAVMTSCGDPVSKVKSIAEQIEKEGNEWTDADQWESAANELLDAFCEFAESEFDEDQLSEGAEAVSDLISALTEVDDSKAIKAIGKAAKRLEKDKSLKKRMETASKKLEKRAKKLKVDEDEILSKKSQRELEENLMKIATNMDLD